MVCAGSSLGSTSSRGRVLEELAGTLLRARKTLVRGACCGFTIGMRVGGADLIPLGASRFVEMASSYEGDELLSNFEVNSFRTALYFVRWASAIEGR